MRCTKGGFVSWARVYGVAGVCAVAWAATCAAQSSAPQTGSTGGVRSSSSQGGAAGGSAGFSGGSAGFTGGSTTGFTGGSAGFSGGSAGFTGGSSGFTGGSTGFTGGSTGFGSGSTGFGTGSGTSFPGGSTLGGSGYGASGSTSSGVSRNNPFYSNYVNPQQMGLPGGSRSAFGTPLYGTSTSTTSRTSGTLGTGYAAGSSGFSAGSGSATGYTAPRAPRYAAGVEYSTTRSVAGGRPPSDVVQVLAGSNALSPERDIQASMDGTVIVLKGTVANDHDRHLAEGMVRLSPGVNDVRNELRVLETLPPPRAGP
jgi:hypothetical protein